MAPFTCEIAARRALSDLSPEPCVDWAERMLLAGFETPTLCILVGETAPFHASEMEALFDRTATELGLPVIGSTEEAVVLLSTALVRRCLEAGGQTGQDALDELATLAATRWGPTDLDTFHVLYLASVDLAAGREQRYREDATSDNIDALIDAWCVDWRDRHPTPAWDPLDWSRATGSS
ncbi:MAG: hypothetical protein AAF409_09500 [Pseudomonadota bacterium]